MCRKARLIVWILILLCLVIGLVGVIIGSTTNVWWKYDGANSMELGLWKRCINDSCSNRPGILKFDDVKFSSKSINSRELDATLLVLVIGGITGVMALVSALSILLCQNDPDKWKCGVLMATLFAFMSAICSIGALIYAESQFESLWSDSDHGWSVILAWIGTCSLLFAFVFSFVLMCISPDDNYDRDAGYSQDGISRSNIGRNGVGNKAYELS